jgi:hypothetical protein
MKGSRGWFGVLGFWLSRALFEFRDSGFGCRDLLGAKGEPQVLEAGLEGRVGRLGVLARRRHQHRHRLRTRRFGTKNTMKCTKNTIKRYK